jgi:Cu/Ag efflux protein CusF
MFFTTEARRPAVQATIIFVGTMVWLVGCGSSPTPAPAEKHYPLQGEVVSVDASKQKLTVNHGDIPGLMPGMTMSYAIGVPQEADGLAAGDKISADLVATDGKMRLEKIVLVEKAKVTPVQESPVPKATTKKP